MIFCNTFLYLHPLVSRVPQQVVHMQSEAFAPTPQFMQVSRIEDNAELRNRRSSITSGGSNNYEYEGGGPSRASNGSSSSVGDSYHGNASSGSGRNSSGVRRQVEQFTEVGSLTDNPEMRRRREAYLHDRIMDHSKVKNE